MDRLDHNLTQSCRYNEDAETMAIKRMELDERKREQEIQEWDDHLQGKGYKNRWDLQTYFDLI